MKRNLLALFVAVFILQLSNGFAQQKALHFDRNSCVDIPEITELTGTAARTIEAWVRVPTSSLDWWQPVIVEWGTNSAGKKWDFRLDHYRLRVEHGGGFAIATTTLNDSLWHHVAVTLPENSLLSEAKFYVDGILDATSESGGSVVADTDNGPISIGRAIADDQSVRYWIGDIDEVRLWNKVVSADDLLANMDRELCLDDVPNLMAYYKMNDGDGTTVKDEMGNYDGTLASGKEEDGIPSWIDGVNMDAADCGGELVTGAGLHFNRNSCVDIPEISDLLGTTARTIDAWVRVPTSSLDWWQPVIVEWGTNSAGKKFDFRLDHYRLRVEHGGGFAIATTTLNDSLWHHVAVTLPENSLLSETKFYVDGMLDATSESGGSVVADTDNGGISIGRAIADDQSVRYWIGDMDEVRLWKRVLSDSEILSLMDSEVCPDDYPALVAYYKFNENDGTMAKDETGNYDGTLASGKEDDGIPSWIEGVAVYAADCNPTYVQDLFADEFIRVYPNPVNDYLNISSKSGISRIQIYNIAGTCVRDISSQNISKLDFSSYNTGIYLLKAVCGPDNEIKIFKVVKQ